MTKYLQQTDGEWIILSNYPFHKIACCDCGLVHKFEFKKVVGGLKFRAWRDERATAARRRKKKV